jgi:hypothetical protein
MKLSLDLLIEMTIIAAITLVGSGTLFFIVIAIYALTH